MSSPLALGLWSYASTLVLATAGTRDRAHEHPWLPPLLAAKVLFDAASGIVLTAEQATRHRRFCSWCLTAAAASIAMVPLALPEARDGLRAWWGRAPTGRDDEDLMALGEHRSP